jgi:hypothetical protein
MAKKESSSPGFVLVYMIPLLLYYFISYKIYMSSIDDKTGLRRKDVDPKSKIALLQLGLMVIVFLLVYSYIVKEMSKHCAIGSKNFGLNSFLYSFIPFLFVFCSLMVALILLPGWKAPFSNTIGYFIVKNVVERKLFNLQEWVKVDGDDDSTKPLRIFNSKNTRTFFVNELTPNNFFGALKQVNIGPDSQHIFHPQMSKDENGNDMMNENSRGLNITKALYSAVVIKDMVSEFIWLLLGGIITYSVAQIYAIDHRCQSGEKDENALQDRLKQQAKATADKASEQAQENSVSIANEDD